MKKISFLLVIFIVSSCGSTRLVDSWKNPEFNAFTPKNVMIIGVTQNTTARMLYEEHIKNELNARGIQASQSGLIFENSFKDAKQTEENIEEQVDRLLELGYDTVIISAVKGIDERVSYRDGMPHNYFYLRRFGRHYFLYQDIYFDPGYYNKYKIYHIETTMYNIKPNTDKQLVWVGSYDLVDPLDIKRSVDRYVRVITQSLEAENLIPRKDERL